MKKHKIYDKIALQEVLTDDKYRTINNQGRVLPPSNKVYEEISQLMTEKGSAITPKHVHTIVNNNRNGLKDTILQTFKIQTSEPTMTSTIMENTINTSGSSTFTDTSFNCGNRSMKLNLVLSAEKWHNIRPKEKTYCNRLYYKLRPGWADVIAEALWVQHHIDCIFISKNNSVHHRNTAKAFMTFFGACKECGAKIAGQLAKEPAKDVDVVLTCQIKDIETSVHTGSKRRPLRGLRRAAVADAVVEKSKDAVVWRRKEAARIKTFGGKDPPILPSNEVVRKAKEQRLLQKYGLNFADSALNLLKSSEYGKFVGSIHHLALLKFACIYWRPEQLQIYIARCRGDANAFLCIDATGGLVKREKANDPHVFLYQCVLVTSEGSVPTFQMVSSDHRSLNVAQFLRLILAANAPLPPIVVTDFGWALLIAVAEIFAKCSSFADYLQKCYDVVTDQSTPHTLPATFMRLDVCHLAAMVSRWKCLTGNGLVRRFYKKCIGKASIISSLDELTYFLESVLVVALSNTIGQSPEKKTLPSEDRVRFINGLIKGICDKDLENEEKNTEESAYEENPEEGNEANDKTNKNWKSWSQNIFLRAQELALQSADGDTINGCHNEEFAKMLMKQLMPYVAIWTNIMLPIFGRGSVTPTSAAVEAEFGDIKHREFKGDLPMRVDRFVLSHIESLDRKITLRSLEKDVVCPEIEEAPSFESSSLNVWTVKEEWGGINKNQKIELVDVQHPPPAKMQKQGQVFYDDCPEWDFIKGSKSAYLPVMINGSLMGPVRLNNCHLNLTDTCAFDSILAIIISGMTQSNLYRDKVAESQCPIIILARDVWIKKKIVRDHYKTRAEILQATFIFKDVIKQFTRGIKRLVATCNAGHLAQTLLELEPSSTVTVRCPCGYRNERKYSLLNINVDIVLKNGLQLMQEAIDDCLSERRICYECDNEATAQNEYGPHLVIDLAVVTDASYAKEENITHTLNSVKKTVCLDNKHYLLSGVVDYKEQKAHYVAYALTGEYWYMYDDLVKKRLTANQQAKIQPHVIVYTICNKE